MFHQWRLIAVVVAGLLVVSCDDISFHELGGQPPVKRISITKRAGIVHEVFVTLESGSNLTNVVDLRLFSGFWSLDTLSDAEREHGKPHLTRREHDMRNDVSLYRVTGGEIGFMSVPTEPLPQLWAYPANNSLDAIVLDESARRQIRSLLDSKHIVRVSLNVPNQRGITLGIRGDRVDYMIRHLRVK